ncbi:hypothetical protein KC332_g3650 [Hortaea werneckii]|uniref:Uncharacterized protein n=2 Tax=Hortaea werneckii TaxID=91943 RepID=A0A3M7GM44_HORWE|nr:hypothetical protein KC350_g10092 [Hortaea werneckii]OTA34682.1 hypothetical protein BTJ68_05314 [Hortaea werneckii EXF-2000]KAI6840456.1 hypothetical protein KC358_g4446 [Hortaea werneckii]KAI6939540.1 hypothetical protein KC341_g4091 [Hortaea werneckii]KAI6947235.1 hypothetical protein KC348_g2652 [Hortaea werneckii]
MSTHSVTGWRPMLKAVGLSLIILTANKHLEHRYWDKAWKTFEEGLPQQFPWSKKDLDAGDDGSKPTKSFYFDELPRDLAIQLVLSLANYQWQCLLERYLPTRPQGNTFTAQEKAKVTDDDDMMEDEVMRRLIAKGKVRRASISWCNVFLKWLINNTITFAVIASAYHVIDDASHLRSLSQMWEDLLLSTLFETVIHWFSISPIFSLIGLTIIPVQHRLPFEQGINFCWAIFFGSFLGTFVPWLMSKQFMQDIMANATEAAWIGWNESTQANTTLPQIDNGPSMGELK